MAADFNFDILHERRGTDCSKWDTTKSGVLPLWVADMDFCSPPEVVEALQAAVQSGIFGYPNFGTQVQETVADWLHARHGWEINPESVVPVPGVVTGFNLSANAVAQPGDGVLIQPPTYGPFLGVAKNFNLVQQEAQLTQGPDGQYQVDLDAFEAAITPETRIFMLCNPQNPTGRVFTRQELENMADICLRHGVTICSDEIHSDLVFSGHTHLPVASLDPSISEHTITLVAPSKTFNIAGLKASAAIIENPDLRKQFNAARQGMVGFVNSLGMVALQAAYRHGAPWLDALLAYLEDNRDLTVQFVRERLPGVQVNVPEATYLAWLDCREAAFDSSDRGQINSFFEQHAKVALNEGRWFGSGGEGFVRLNFGCPRAILMEALGRMEAALKQKI
jgi:cystathionine beta-lyase